MPREENEVENIMPHFKYVSWPLAVFQVTPFENKHTNANIITYFTSFDDFLTGLLWIEILRTVLTTGLNIITTGLVSQRVDQTSKHRQ